MTTFPDIADYAFLSDCEVSTLDRARRSRSSGSASLGPTRRACSARCSTASAGIFRFGPSGIDVPNQRRYVPGTNVLETTWHTPTGWLIVWDLLVMGPRPADERRERYRRVPGDTMASGHAAAHRHVLRAGGSRSRSNCLPQFDYGRDERRVELRRRRVRAGHGHVGATSPLDLTGQHAPRHPRARGRTAARRSRRANRPGWRLSWEGQAPTTLEEATAQREATEKYWRDWLALAKIHDHRLAAVHRAQRAGTEGAQLRADRGDHGRGHHVVARDARRRAQLGLPLHLDPRHRVHAAARSTTSASSGRRSSTSRSCSRRWHRRSASGEPNLQIMYGIGGETDLTEHTLDHLSGYRNSRPVRIGNGAFDQHQHDVWGMLLDAVGSYQRQRRPDPDPGVGRPRQPRRHKPSNGSPSPTRASGRCGASRSTSSRRR